MTKDVTKEDIKKIARLARIELSEEELQSYTKEITEILKYVEKLNEVDVSDLNYQPHHALRNVWSEDIVEDSLPQEKALSGRKNSASKGYFTIHKVIDK